MKTNDLLVAVNLLDRAITLMQPNSRTAIPRTTLGIINTSLGGIYDKVLPHTKDNAILVPLAEVTELLRVLLNDPRYVETDMEAKDIIIKKLTLAQHELYVATGKFYDEANEFDRLGPAMDPVLIKIVNACIDAGIYFGVDKEV